MADNGGASPGLAASQEQTFVMQAKKPIDLRDPTIVITASEKDSEQSVGLLNNYERYDDIQPLGEGGIGLVCTCIDPHLGREVAIKVLKPKYQRNREQRTRFVREARVMSQLEHPNIVPVHEMGTRPDRSIYFSMKRINGIELKEVIDGLIMEDPEMVEKYPRSELISLFLQVCQAVAFAHSRSVIHRDLKPENILIGSFGEVLVLDWGLAKIIGEDEDAVSKTSHDIDEILDLDRGTTTLDGNIAGTPLYMAPEQAEGKNSELDQRTDIYTLGVILYEILTLEKPITGQTVREIILNIATGNFVRPRRVPYVYPRVPLELDAICMKALATNPKDRYQSVVELITDLERYRAERQVSAFRDPLLRRAWKWCKRHSILSSSLAASLAAIVLVVSGIALAHRTRQNSFLAAGEAELDQAKTSHAALMEKWARYDKMRSQRLLKEVPENELLLKEEVDKLQLKTHNKLTFAMYLLNQAGLSERIEARQCLAQIHEMRADYAVAQGDYGQLKELLGYFRKRLGDNFERASEKGRARLNKYAAVARRNGTLSVKTSIPGVEVGLWKYEERDGKLRPTYLRQLGQSDMKKEILPVGSYLLTVPRSTSAPALDTSAPLPRVSRHYVYFPVMINQAEDAFVDAFVPKNIPKGFVYVPAGKFYFGGSASRSFRLHQRDVAGFFIRETEVTFGEYLRFWLDPRGGNKRANLMSRVRVARDDYRFLDAWNSRGKLIDLCKAQNPVVGVTQEAAEAYCRWLSLKTGKPCRLPSAEEWEKAARGVDGRMYVWGNVFNSNYAFTVENAKSHGTFQHWAPPRSHPSDVSVYGAYDMGGNVREWTLSKFPNSPYYQIKGASASLTKRFLNCAYSSDTPVVPSDVGFRYLLQLDPQ